MRVIPPLALVQPYRALGLAAARAVGAARALGARAVADLGFPGVAALALPPGFPARRRQHLAGPQTPVHCRVPLGGDVRPRGGEVVEAERYPQATKATFDGEVYLDLASDAVSATFHLNDAAKSILTVTFQDGKFTVL